jgi:hypothetical protein
MANWDPEPLIYQSTALAIQSNKSPDPRVRTLALIYYLFGTDLLVTLFRVGPKRRDRVGASGLCGVDR